MNYYTYTKTSMFRKLFLVLSTLFFAFSVLLISVFRVASVRYEFANKAQEPLILGENESVIDYQLPFPGKVLPDSPFWPLKALRDKIWLWVTTNPTRSSELKLLFADKRLGSSRILFEQGNPEIGLSTLTKAEKYLEESSVKEDENRYAGLDTTEFLIKIAKSSLRHYESMEYILTLAPEEAKPTIIQTQDYAKKVFEKSRNALLEKKITPPENPFNW